MTKCSRVIVPKYSRIILLIEFEYGSRCWFSGRPIENADNSGVYINSLALQAVLEQWTANGGQDYNPQNPGASSASLMGSYKKNEYYIKETIDASRSLLRHVVNGLFPNDNLKHAPVRTHMRILSGAMFLLKVGSSSFLNSLLTHADFRAWSQRGRSRNLSALTRRNHQSSSHKRCRRCSPLPADRRSPRRPDL